jgi:hypothetical protein
MCKKGICDKLEAQLDKLFENRHFDRLAIFKPFNLSFNAKTVFVVAVSPISCIMP